MVRRGYRKPLHDLNMYQGTNSLGQWDLSLSGVDESNVNRMKFESEQVAVIDHYSRQGDQYV